MHAGSLVRGVTSPAGAKESAGVDAWVPSSVLMQALPGDVWNVIAKWLEPSEAARLAATCRAVRLHVCQDTFWTVVVRSTWPDDVIRLRACVWNWQLACQRLLRDRALWLDAAWRRSSCSERNTLQLSGEVIGLAAGGSHVLVASHSETQQQATLSMLDYDTGRCVVASSFDTRTFTPSAFASSGTAVALGSTSGTIKLWMPTYSSGFRCIATYPLSSSSSSSPPATTITSLAGMYNWRSGVIWAGNEDGDITGIDVGKNTASTPLLRIASAHLSAVTCLDTSCVNPAILLSGSSDLMLRVWDTRAAPSAARVMLLAGTDPVQCAVLDDLHGRVIAGGRFFTSMYDLRTGTKVIGRGKRQYCKPMYAHQEVLAADEARGKLNAGASSIQLSQGKVVVAYERGVYLLRNDDLSIESRVARYDHEVVAMRHNEYRILAGLEGGKLDIATLAPAGEEDE